MYSINDLPPRVAAKIDVQPDPPGHWMWTDAPMTTGYGRMRWEGGSPMAHRLVYHLLADPTLVPCPGKGTDDAVDHLCRVKMCVNPVHLKPGTRRENCLVGLNGVLGAHHSPFVGVVWARGRWAAQIGVGVSGHRHLGRFDTELAAAIVYDNAAEALTGERTNERLGLLAGYPAATIRRMAREFDDGGVAARQKARAQALAARDAEWAQLAQSGHTRKEIAARYGVSRGRVDQVLAPITGGRPRLHSSQFLGVSWRTQNGRWLAQTGLDGRKCHLGYFHSEVAAAIAYDDAVQAINGDRPNERLGLLDGCLDEEATA